MVLMITKTVTTYCECKQVSLNDLHVCCSAIGVMTTKQPRCTVSAQELQPSNCNGLETITCSVETLRKQSVQHLDGQYNLNVNPEHDADTVKGVVVGHI